MKLRSIATLSIIMWFSHTLFAQNQLALNKKPNFNLLASSYKIFGENSTIPNQGIAMIVKSSKSDFAVTLINEEAKQNWLVEMEGYPLAISNHKNNVIIIYASEKTFFGGVKNLYTAKILDAKNGATIKEQKIYEGSTEYHEDPEFYFSNDNSQFTLISRETNSKKGLRANLNPFKSTVDLQKEQFRSTRNYALIRYDENLQYSKIISPEFYPEQSFQHFLTKSGGMVLAHYNLKNNQVQFDLYDGKQEKLVSKVILKLADVKKFDEISLFLKYNPIAKSYYTATLYETTSKAKKLVLSKINFDKGTIETKEEIMEKNFLGELSKTHSPINKKLDDFKLSNYYYFNLSDVHVVDEKLALEFTSSFVEISGGARTYTSQSALIKFYDENLNQKFQTILPRFLYSYSPDVSNLSITTDKNTATIIGNTKNWQISYIPVSMKLDMSSGNVLSYERISSKDIDDKFYIRTNQLNKFSNGNILLTYTERFGGLKSNYDTILQVVDAK